jgi:hypothetical protein
LIVDPEQADEAIDLVAFLRARGSMGAKRDHARSICFRLDPAACVRNAVAFGGRRPTVI